jgi:hypothetical protein
MDEIEKKPDGLNAGDSRRPYERPDIVWEEEYKPTAFGMSCLKEVGNPGCNPGPVTN